MRNKNKIRPYLKDIIEISQKTYTCKIKLTIATDFMSSKDTQKERVMYSRSDNIDYNM